MNLHKYSPVLLTLLVFLLARELGSVLLFVVELLLKYGLDGLLSVPQKASQPGFSLLELMPVSHFSLIMLAASILGVWCCHLLLHNLCFIGKEDFSSIRWRPGLWAVVGGVLGAMSLSILTEKVELPDAALQISVAMSRDIFGLFMLVLVGPVVEELIFREAIEGEMLRRGVRPWVAIGISALAFGLVHLNLAQGLYAFPVGILLGIIYYKSGNIILSSLLHIINNIIAAAQLHIMGEDIAGYTYAELFGSSFAAYTIMTLFALLCIVLMKMFWDGYRLPEKQQAEP